MIMDAIAQLEAKFDSLLGRIRQLEEEKAALEQRLNAAQKETQEYSDLLDRERGTKSEVEGRIEALLKKVQEEIG